MVAAGFLMNYGFTFAWSPLIDAPDADPSFLTIAAGISNADPDNNEELAQDFYYDNAGGAETDVVGLQQIWSFEGHRKYGDPAQDLIFNELALKTGPDRKGTFKITFPDGKIVKGNSTIANIKDAGGDANSKGDISFEIHYAGVPTVTQPAP